MSPFTITVSSHERAIEYRNGCLTRVLEPGRHRVATRAVYQRVDVRDRLSLVSPQELLAADGVTVRVTAAMRWAVADAARFVETTTDPLAVVYLAVQIALRDVLAELDADTLVRSGRRTASAALTASGRTAGAEVGIDVRDVVVKDVMLPHELRDAYTELVAARQRAQAQLEAARAETAALRSLANGAKLLDQHPALAQLRLVQALPTGSTVRLGVGPGVGPGVAPGTVPAES